MIDQINKFLRSLLGVTVGNRINNEVQLREWSCSIQGIEHMQEIWMAQCGIFDDPKTFNNLIIKI